MIYLLFVRHFDAAENEYPSTPVAVETVDEPVYRFTRSSLRVPPGVAAIHC
jgi:hypothetical protein